MSHSLGRTEWSELNDLTLRLHRVRSARSFEEFLLTEVASFLGAEFASWNQHNSQMFLTEVRNTPDYESRVKPLLPALNKTLPSHPLFDHFMDFSKGKVRYVEQVERTRDHIDDDAFFELPWYREVAKQLGIQDQILMHVCVKGGRGVLLTYHGAEKFSDGDLLKAAILRGHIIARLYTIFDESSLQKKLQDSVQSELKEFLSVREFEVVGKLCQGLSNQEIAQELDLSPRTVEKHVASILEKTGEKRRARVIARYGAWLS